MDEQRPRFDRWAWASLILCMGIGAALRFYRLGSQSFWFDEVISAWTANAPLSRVVAFVLGNEHGPPGYYFLLNLWRRLAGSSETSLRLPSAVFGVATIPLMVLLARRLWGAAEGHAAGILIALSSFHLRYSQEARPYTLLVLLSVTACYLFVLMLDDATVVRQALFVLTAGALLWVHPMGWLAIVALDVYYGLIFAAGQRPALGLRRWITLQAAAFLLFAPWVGQLLISASVGELWITPVTWRAVGLSMTDWAGGWGLLSTVVPLMLLAIGCGIRRRERQVLLAVLLTIMPGVVLAIASVVWKPIYVPRFAIALLIGACLLTARGITSLGRRGGWIALVVLVSLWAGHFVPMLLRQGTVYPKDDIKSAAQVIATSADAGDVVWYRVRLHDYPLDYYLRQTHLAIVGERDDRASAHHIWAVLPTGANADLPVNAPGRSWHAGKRWAFQGVDLIRYDTDKD